MKTEVSTDRAHRLLAGRPTCLLTTRYRDRINIMAIAWVCPISLEPPLVMMALHPSAYTHDMLRRSEECVLNIPGRPLLEHVQTCGTVSGADDDKIKITGLTLDSGRRVEVPWVYECLAHLECGIVDVIAPGDHSLFIAQILGAWAEEEAFSEIWLAPQEAEDLLPFYHLGDRAFGLFGPMITTRGGP